MPTLDIERQYEDNTALTTGQLDALCDSVETFVNVTKLDSDNIQDAAIGPSQLSNDITDNSTLEQNASTNKIGIKDLGVTAAKLADGAVTTDKIASGAITNAKVADNSLSIDKLAARGISTGSASAGSISKSGFVVLSDVSNASLTDITGLSTSITTTGRPVMVTLEPDLTPTGSRCGGIYMANNTAVATASLALIRGSTQIALWKFGNTTSIASNQQFPASTFTFIDDVAAGTYTYKFQYSASSATFSAVGVRAAVYEII